MAPVEGCQADGPERFAGGREAVFLLGTELAWVVLLLRAGSAEVAGAGAGDVWVAGVFAWGAFAWGEFAGTFACGCGALESWAGGISSRSRYLVAASKHSPRFSPSSSASRRAICLSTRSTVTRRMNQSAPDRLPSASKK